MNPTKSIALRFLTWFCPEHLLEEIEGDLIQKFERDVKSFGERKAKRRLRWNVIRFFRPGIIFRHDLTVKIYPFMTMNNLKFTWRSIQRHRVFSVVNLLGLAMGVSVCLLILNYVLFERSFDQFNNRHSDIVRVGYTRLIDNEPQFSKAQVFPAVGETLKEEIPEVEAFTRIFPITTHVEGVISVERDGDKKSFAESSIFAVDTSFLKVFPLQLLRGDGRSALLGDSKILLSETLALKYFISTDVVNKVLRWDGMGDYVVTGVFKDLPHNSHMKFNAVTSWMNVYEDRSKWNWDGFYTYLLLNPHTNRIALQAKVQQVLEKRMMESAVDKNVRVTSIFFLQPLDDIHLTSNLAGELEPNGSHTIINILLLVAALILFLALTNYINLSVARAIRRAKEVGVRKIIGSSRIQLMSLFFTESFVLSFIAFLFGVILMVVLLPYFNSLSGKSVEITLWDNAVQFVLFALIGILTFAGLAGYYPSSVLASYKPVLALKGGSGDSRKNGLRKTLLVVQFIITIVLVTASLVIQRQVSFMQHQNLGFSLNQKMVIKTFAEAGQEIDSTFISKLELFKSRLKKNVQIKNATITSSIPGRENEWIGRLRRSEQDKELISLERTRVDMDFIATYGLALSAGRNFESDNPKQIILNQAAVKMLGFKTEADAVGTIMMKEAEVVGVVKDFHQRSLHEPILPYMFMPGAGYMKFITVDISALDSYEARFLVEKEWRAVFDKPFEYFFLDEFFNRQYGQEHQLGTVFKMFSLIGIWIACLGLFGFTYFITHQRIKEIGIRKTLGASFINLITLLSSEFIFILLASGVSAACVSYYAAEEWLEKYPVRMEMNWPDFLVPVMMVGAFSFCSIIVLLIRAVRINPTEVLRNE